MKYCAYGVVLESSVDLPELTRADAGCPCVSFDVREGAIPPAAWQWLRPPALAGHEPWLAIAASPVGYRLQFEGTADFFVSADGRHVATDASSDDDDASVRHLFIDQALPLALAHQGRFVLHASAVEVEGVAVAFIGPAGAGKSTVAASFALTGRAIVSDDALTIEESSGTWKAVPAYPSVRLWPDVLGSLRIADSALLPQVGDYTEKRRLGVEQGLTFCSAPMPLQRIYLLRRSDDAGVSVAPLSARDAAMTLVRHSYVLDIADRARLREHFDAACGSTGVAFRTLSYPADPALLSHLRAAIVADLQAATHTSR